MKKGLKRFLLVILALFLTYQVYDFLWECNREKKIEQIIVAMQNSVDELEGFLRKNQDDLEFLVTKCVEDNISINVISVTTAGANPKEISVGEEILSRRNRLIANLPNNVEFDCINSVGLKLNNKDMKSETLHIKISSPPFTQGFDGYTSGSIGTIKLDHTWTIDVGVYDYWDHLRARKILERMQRQSR